ncbi:MAG: RdgB/HAM1 family non-canonical purine NTP pyrophosphatase [Planctomycetia bacterium]|nr:RdgB/HAM1 family non-canonical purine NTP pyrophosphatase [Planctomycetia bacterium]
MILKQQYPPLILGTHNQKKKGEMALLLEPIGFQLHSLAEYPNSLEVEETGATFGENSRQKASIQAKHLGAWVIGEDSGLEVAALDGRPGIYSARYSAPDPTDEKNNLKLLDELGDLPWEKRAARYVCHIALSDPEGNIRLETENYCGGRIRFSPSGTNGFGYDPLFEIVEYHRTFGELSPELKSCISHRARAMRAFVRGISSLFEREGS